MNTKNGKKARYERLYAKGIMYLAKGETPLAERFLNEAATALKEYVLLLEGEERQETKEWFLELCGAIKDLRRYHGSEKVQEQAVSAEGADDSFQLPESEIPNVSFSDVVGLERVKEQVYDMIIYPRQYRTLYERFKKRVGGGILLYGPPGNGKTMIAKAIAHETGSAFYPIKFSDLGSKWFGETEGRIKRLFEEARRVGNAVIFFDEIDAIASERSESSAMDRTVAELLTQMDGINRVSGDLTVIAATNKPQSLDPAIVRAGRFDERIFVPLPDARARAIMIEKRLSGIPTEVTGFEEIAELCDGFSGAEIDLVCEKAKQRVIRRIISGAPDSIRIVTHDIKEAIKEVSASR